MMPRELSAEAVVRVRQRALFGVHGSMKEVVEGIEESVLVSYEARRFLGEFGTGAPVVCQFFSQWLFL